jgi:hypothetical protein
MKFVKVSLRKVISFVNINCMELDTSVSTVTRLEAQDPRIGVRFSAGAQICLFATVCRTAL